MKTRLIVAITVIVAAIAATADPSAASGISGYSIVSESTEPSSESVQQVTVWCPEGKDVLGTGAELGFVDDDVHITGVVPGRSSVTAYASERDGGYVGNWYLKVIAVCADPMAGREVVTETSYSTEGPHELVGVGCSSGKVLLDTSARVREAYTLSDQPTLPDVILNGLGGSEDWASARAFEDEDGTSTRWVLNVYAICADPIVGLVRVSTRDVIYTNIDDSLTGKASCPAGKRALGGGAVVFVDGLSTIQHEEGEVSLLSLKPVTYQDQSYYSARSAEDRTGLSSPLGVWTLDVWVKCAPVYVAIRR